MSDSASATNTVMPQPPVSRAVLIAALAASLMVGAFAISTQSYWIDEALSLIVAMSPNPSEAWKYAQAVSGSTLQMPLYQVYLYVWHKMFGGSEWAMRASNLPWFLFGQLAFLIVLRHRPKLALLGCLLAAVSPILWVYLDETRPYVMQYAAACWLAATILRLTTTPASNLLSSASAAHISDPLAVQKFSLAEIAAIATSGVVLFASSLIGVIWCGAFVFAIAGLLVSQKNARPVGQPALWLIGLLALALIVGFSAYYIFTWHDAGRGYHRSGVSLLSLPFIAYELLGFSGFGPGKLQLRADPVPSVLASMPALVPLAATFAALALFAITHLRGTPWNKAAIVSWLTALGLPTVAIFAAMFLFDHRPLPRHFIPALPALILLLAALLRQALEQKSVFWRALAVLLPVLWLASAFNYRWHASHAKDDYRSAAKVAAAALAENKEVWWAADPAAAYIYLTPIAMEEVPGRAWAMQAPSWDDIRFKFPPRVIVISKPDIYDPQGAVARYAAENRFVPALQLQAFTIFAREGEELPAVGQP